MSRFAWQVTGDQASAIPPDEAPEHRADLVWVHLSVSDEDAKTWLAETARLSAYVIDGLTAVETRPRCTVMDDGALINLRGRSSQKGASDLLASIRMYARKGLVVSVTRHPLEALETVRRAVAAGRVADPGDLIAAFASAITEELDPIVAELGDTLDDCETALDAHSAFELRRTVNRVRSEAIGYRRFLNPQRAAIEKLAGLPAEWLHEDDRIHLASAADRAARMAEEVEAIRERAALMHETLTDLRSELIDQRSLLIAIAAMIFLPLTFVTGLYGMNVQGLWLADRPWAFDAIAGFCIVVVLAITGYFTWKHWTR